MTSDLDIRERHELCDRFLDLGPDAPTLCGEWTTADLAAHLVVRERDPRAAPGILLGGRFEPLTERLMAAEGRRGYEAVVERVRNGPPCPLSFGPVRYLANMVEYTVHHEDVRRANGEKPRVDRADLDDAIWAMLRRMAPLMVRKAGLDGISLVLRAPDFGERVAGRKGRRVTLVGAPVELLLYLYGRKEQAEVSLIGSTHDLAAVDAGSFGI